MKPSKFVTNVPDLNDKIGLSPQSTVPKLFVSCKEESMHVLGLKSDHNNETLIVSRATNRTITKTNTVLGSNPCVKGLRRNWYCSTVYSRCSFNLKRHLECQ